MRLLLLLLLGVAVALDYEAVLRKEEALISQAQRLYDSLQSMK